MFFLIIVLYTLCNPHFSYIVYRFCLTKKLGQLLNLELADRPPKSNVMFFVYPFIACLMCAFQSKNLSNILFLVFSSILTYRGICGTVFLFHIFLWVLHFFIIYKAATDTVLLLTVIFRSQIKTNQWQNTTEKNHIVDYHTMWYYS